MSLLLAEGHSNARQYPVAVVWSEARLVRLRHVRRMQAEALIMQTVIASLFGGKEGVNALNNLLEGMEDVG